MNPFDPHSPIAKPAETSTPTPSAGGNPRWKIIEDTTVADGECYLCADKLEVLNGVVLTLDNESIVEIG